MSSLQSEDPRPLAGVKVCDLTRILAGPYATMKLGDMGADIIKVERPGAGDDTRAWGPPFFKGQSTYHLAINRSKRSLCLDLKRGAAVLERLIAASDVVIENFRPGTLARLGFPWERIQQINPRAIYCSISGYGHANTERHEPSYDVIVQGQSGVQGITGFPDGPPTRLGVSLADLMAGQHAVEGILLALHKRHRTGLGERVDIALLDGMLSLLTYQAQMYLCCDQEPGRLGNAHPSIVPYQAFETADGDLNIGVANEKLWAVFCQAIARPELQGDARFATNKDRVAHRAELIAILGPLFASQSTAHWLALFKAAGIPAGAIETVAQALEGARAAGRDMISEVEHTAAGAFEMVGNPVKLGGLGFQRRFEPPPVLGAHSEAILGELGYSADEVAGLREQGVI